MLGVGLSFTGVAELTSLTSTRRTRDLATCSVLQASRVNFVEVFDGVLVNVNMMICTCRTLANTNPTRIHAGGASDTQEGKKRDTA